MCLTVLQAGSASAGESVSGGEAWACIFKKLSKFLHPAVAKIDKSSLQYWA